MDKKTMEQAIRDEIDAFVKNGCEFSAHAITQNIRTKVNSGSLEIDTLQMVTLGGKQTQYIEHQIVRDLVHQICGFGNLSGYERKWNSVPNLPTGGYFVWAPSGTHDDDDDADDDADDDDNAVFSATANATAKQAYSPASPTDPVVVGKVLNYFDHRLSIGTPATLHSTQRRMKRSPLTIDQIKAIAESNKYVVETFPGKPVSDSIVKAASGN